MHSALVDYILDIGGKLFYFIEHSVVDMISMAGMGPHVISQETTT